MLSILSRQIRFFRAWTHVPQRLPTINVSSSFVVPRFFSTPVVSDGEAAVKEDEKKAERPAKPDNAKTEFEVLKIENTNDTVINANAVEETGNVTKDNDTASSEKRPIITQGGHRRRQPLKHRRKAFNNLERRLLRPKRK